MLLPPRRALRAGVAWFAAAAALLAACGGGASGVKTSTPDTAVVSEPVSQASPTPPPTATPTPAPRYFNVLNGAPMSAAEWTVASQRLPIAIMVDNNVDAFPQAGLDRADLVYEAFVEGGSTRFMAVFWSKDADPVEPIRSARTPFLYWVLELGALYGHGGSAETYNEANAGGQLFDWNVRDLEAFADRGAAAYYRDPDRSAPHDLATSTQKLRDAASELSASDPLYAGDPAAITPWTFRDDDAGLASRPAAGGLEIDWNASRLPLGVVQWRYDPATKRYLRFQFGNPHIDALSKAQLGATNVIVVVAPHEVVDDSGHVLYDLVGSGPMQVFSGGHESDGTWKKADRTGRTLFYDAAGKPIALGRGVTWIEVVGPETPVQVAATAAALPPLPAYTLPEP